MAPDQLLEPQNKAAVPVPSPKDPKEYDFALWKVFKALGISALIWAALLLVIQFVIGYKIF